MYVMVFIVVFCGDLFVCVNSVEVMSCVSCGDVLVCVVLMCGFVEA